MVSGAVRGVATDVGRKDRIALARDGHTVGEGTLVAGDAVGRQALRAAGGRWGRLRQLCSGLTALVAAPYLGTMTALVSCGSCGCPVKRGEKACPFCGASLRTGRAGGRSTAAAAMGLATAVTVGVGAGACGSTVETGGSGGAGGTSAMESTTFVAAYGPPPTFCAEGSEVRDAVNLLSVNCHSCAESLCCAEMESCGIDCAACLEDDASCASQAASEQAAALRTCLSNGCGSSCNFHEICESGAFANTAECASCLGTSCCPEVTACAADPDCTSCLQGNATSCDATMLDEDAISCTDTNCADACM